MKLYNETRDIRKEDPKAADEDYSLAEEKLNQLMSTAFEDREEPSKATHKSSYAAYFDKQYTAQGGLAKLIELYNSGLSNPAMAEHFGMTEQGMSNALKKILGGRYIAYPLRGLSSMIKPPTVAEIL